MTLIKNLFLRRIECNTMTVVKSERYYSRALSSYTSGMVVLPPRKRVLTFCSSVNKNERGFPEYNISVAQITRHSSDVTPSAPSLAATQRRSHMMPMIPASLQAGNCSHSQHCRHACHELTLTAGLLRFSEHLLQRGRGARSSLNSPRLLERPGNTAQSPLSKRSDRPG